ncbi:hypothetical protein AALT_g10318 [Alternaria alternata]|nr:hypothetical protein AALT_g10318 [Alternaria alternata]
MSGYTSVPWSQDSSSRDQIFVSAAHSLDSPIDASHKDHHGPAASFAYPAHKDEPSHGTTPAMAALSNTTASPVAGYINSSYDVSYPCYSNTPTHGTNNSLESIRGMEPAMAAGDPLPTLFFAQQNQAISDFVKKGIHPDTILQMVQKFKIAVWNDNFSDLAIMAVSHDLSDLAIMAEIPMEELDNRIKNVVYALIPSMVENGPNIKREPSDETLEHATTRALVTTKDKKPKQRGKRNNKPTVHVYGCVGDGGKCEKQKRRYWRSRKAFEEHFETHLEEYRTSDGFVCTACERCESSPGVISIFTTSFSHFRDLVTHIWKQHMVPSTTLKQTQGKAALAKAKLGEYSGIQSEEADDTKSGGDNNVGLSSGTPHGHADGIEHDNFDMMFDSLPAEFMSFSP